MFIRLEKLPMMTRDNTIMLYFSFECHTVSLRCLCRDSMDGCLGDRYIRMVGMRTFNLSICLCMGSYPKCNMKGSTQSAATLRTSAARSSRQLNSMGTQIESSSRWNDFGGTVNK